VKHLPADGGAIGGLCQEPRWSKGTSGDWRRTDQVKVLLNKNLVC
jgi:hypothetical protein